MISINDLPSVPLKSTDATDCDSRHALYCPQTGTRLAPELGMSPPSGSAVAVLVFDDGETTSISRDSLLGRLPNFDRAVAAGERDGVTISDPARSVSRSHLLLRVQNWSLEAIDLGSQNGTLLLGRDEQWQRMTPGLAHLIADGQRLRIGSKVIAVHYTARAYRRDS